MSKGRWSKLRPHIVVDQSWGKTTVYGLFTTMKMATDEANRLNKNRPRPFHVHDVAVAYPVTFDLL
jgi:hypothetical protein